MPLAASYTFLELRTLDRDGPCRLPFWVDPLEFRINGELWLAQVANEEIVFQRDGHVVHATIGQEVELSQARARVVDLRLLPPFWLVALSPELGGKSWPISRGETLIGRPGKRHNRVALTHPSVSRTHATIAVDVAGGSLRSDSEALTAVNGEPLKPGRVVELSAGDILQLGELHLSWQKE